MHCFLLAMNSLFELSSATDSNLRLVEEVSVGLLVGVSAILLLDDEFLATSANNGLIFDSKVQTFVKCSLANFVSLPLAILQNSQGTKRS